MVDSWNEIHHGLGGGLIVASKFIDFYEHHKAYIKAV